jgi:hypothetical protein
MSINYNKHHKRNVIRAKVNTNSVTLTNDTGTNIIRRNVIKAIVIRSNASRPNGSRKNVIRINVARKKFQPFQPANEETTIGRKFCIVCLAGLCQK